MLGAKHDGKVERVNRTPANELISLPSMLITFPHKYEYDTILKMLSKHGLFTVLHKEKVGKINACFSCGQFSNRMSQIPPLVL